MVKLPIYMDYQATTPVDPEVMEVMLPYFTEKFGNAHSRSHSFGWESSDAVEVARKQIADVIKADAKEVIFTSGATESNNLALKGAAYFYKDHKKHIITVKTEHKCVLDACRHLEEDGFEVTYLPVGSDGLLDLHVLEKNIRPDTLLVSIMSVNNEIGVIQPIKEIGEICRKNGSLFHTDAAQAFGKIPLDVDLMNIDMLSISAHKIYGPKGVGALYVRKRPRVRLSPLMNGGGQERGMRSGTVPTPLIVGFGKAAEIANSRMEEDFDRIKKLADRFTSAINDQIPDVYFNGNQVHKWPGCVNVSFAYIEGESLILAIKGLAVSSGSACTSASLEPSYVLKSLGLEDELAHSSIRFGFGRFSTEEQVDYALEVIFAGVKKLRDMSPLWEMAQEGIDLRTVQWTDH